jgi:hypothetical protein
VRTLAEWTETLYAGTLGYLIVSVPRKWHDKERGIDFVETLRDHLSVRAEADAVDVRAASPREEDGWAEHAADYFGVVADAAETVAGVESHYEGLVEREEWRSTALGTRSGTQVDAESDDHYLIKSKLAETIAHRWYLESDSESYREYNQFFRDAVLGSDSELLQTEAPLRDPKERDSDSGVDPIADVKIHIEDDSLADALDSVFSTSDPALGRGDEVVVEYESGRAQAGTNFRKVRDTLEKYEDADVDHVLVVVSPATLRTGPRRAHLIERLVWTWNQEVEDTDARLCVPSVSNRAHSLGVDVTLSIVNPSLSKFTHSKKNDD